MALWTDLMPGTSCSHLFGTEDNITDIVRDRLSARA